MEKANEKRWREFFERSLVPFGYKKVVEILNKDTSPEEDKKILWALVEEKWPKE